MNDRHNDVVINHYREEYLAATGNDYNDSKYPTLDVVPDALKDIVSSIKVLTLEQRQLEILNEIGSLPLAGDARVISDAKESLPDEFNKIKDELEKWKLS